MSRVCVKNLSDRIDEPQLRAHFGARGEITDCRLARTKSGKSRHFGFIGFRTEEQARDAIRYFNNTYLLTNKITVESADRIGNEDTLKKSRSKYTQQKLKKLYKTKESAKALELEERKIPLMKSSTKPIDKKKLDFLEAMKARRNAKVWSNDEGLQTHSGGRVESASVADLNEGQVEDNERGDKESDMEDAEKSNLNNAVAHSSVSDMEYLKSKMKVSASVSTAPPSDGTTTAATLSNHDTPVVNDNAEGEVDEDRIFVRNLPYLCTEEELRALFSAYGEITTVHLPLNGEKRSKGFGFVQFMLPESADKALQAIDGTPFQGRLLHVIKAKKAPEPVSANTLYTKGLSSFQKQKEEERRKLLHVKEGWNASFVRSDAVVESLADRYAMTRSDILDTTEGGGELAVRMAMGETHVLKENRDFFIKHNVDLNVLESNTSNNRAQARSSTTLLVKNLPHSVIPEELEDMFSKFGSISSFLVPPSKTLALVDFYEPTEARAAYKGLAYRKYKHLPLYLEWAPQGTISKPLSNDSNAKEPAPATKAEQLISDEDVQDDYSSLFLKNLNFSTTEEQLKNHISLRGCQGLRAVSIPKKRKGEALLSMGFGFAEFSSTENAAAAIKLLHGSALDGHAMEVKPTDKRISRSITGKRPLENSESEKNTKIIVRNVAFQATLNEIKALFSAFGVVKRVRIPKKVGNVHRGFAFVEFSSSQEASHAMSALRNTHLYGRHLVLEWAKENDDGVDELRKKAKTDARSITGGGSGKGSALSGKSLKAAIEDEQRKQVLDEGDSD